MHRRCISYHIYIYTRINICISMYIYICIYIYVYIYMCVCVFEKGVWFAGVCVFSKPSSSQDHWNCNSCAQQLSTNWQHRTKFYMTLALTTGSWLPRHYPPRMDGHCYYDQKAETGCNFVAVGGQWLALVDFRFFMGAILYFSAILQP